MNSNLILIKNGRDIQIPQSDKKIVQLDNNIARIFKLPRVIDSVDLSSYSFTVQVEPINKLEIPYFNLIEKQVSEDEIILIWNIERHDTKDIGKLEFNIKVADENDRVFHSWIGYFDILPSIDTEKQGELLPPSYIEQGVTQVSHLVDTATEQANKAEVNANLAVSAKDSSELAAQQASSSSIVSENAKNDIIGRQQDITQKHSDVVAIASDVAINATQVSLDKDIVNGIKQDVINSAQNAKTSEINAKDSEVKAKISETTATEQAYVSTDQANGASLNKDATEAILNDVGRMQQEITLVQNYVQSVYSNCLGVLNQQESLLSVTPYYFMKSSIDDMYSITTMKDGDFCIVFDGELNAQGTYRYFVNDSHGNPLSQPTWVWLTALSLVNITRDYLLSVLGLPTVAISGSYNDLIDKPNRYESFITLHDGNWDYSTSDKVIINSAVTLNITNVYNGAVGLIRAYAEPILPSNSKFAEDFNDISTSQYTYMFYYDGVNFIWTRSGIIA